ncbi:HNH endonuclease [Pelosinus sp. sgz500959]|uniref:HNH endonuclease n=1 Tax=Pelosinus sp. sgz500959 TaxID=3242472 RepID=UPI00366B07D8
MRDIGIKISRHTKLDGWNSWSIIHFYGFNKNAKGFYTHITLKKLIEELGTLNENEMEQFYLSEKTLEDIMIESNLNLIDSDATDVFRNIKIRIGENKLRKQLLENYNHTCALCKISNPKLLMTRHIKTWIESSREERINPKNAILLCKLHDALFENGFISLSDQYEVIFSTNFDFNDQGISTDIRFTCPKQDAPDPIFMLEHRKKNNLTISQSRFF